MRRIVIKNLSTLWDDTAVMITQHHLVSLRSRRYDCLFKSDKERFQVDVKIEDNDTEITYTVTDSAKSDEKE